MSRTWFITGASRGIGKAIALRAAREGHNVVVVGKTDRPHPNLPGTIHSAAAEVEAAGGRGFACRVDIRFEEQVQAAVDQATERFGGIDVVVNNASAIFLSRTLDTPMKRFDLMHAVNTRGTFLVSRCSLPLLLRSQNPHILNIAPPLNLDPKWFEGHLAYSLAKMGMSLCVLGMAAEFRDARVAVNALWPRTAIATSAIRNLLGGEEAIRHCRKPEIMADAAWAVVQRDFKDCTGQFLIDDEVLVAEGEEDLDKYSVEPGADLLPDFFL